MREREDSSHHGYRVCQENRILGKTVISPLKACPWLSGSLLQHRNSHIRAPSGLFNRGTYEAAGWVSPPKFAPYQGHTCRQFLNRKLPLLGSITPLLKKICIHSAGLLLCKNTPKPSPPYAQVFFLKFQLQSWGAVMCSGTWTMVMATAVMGKRTPINCTLSPTH